MGRIPSGLFILTARRDNVETGMLASWVQQCGFEPPQITLALQRNRALADWLVEGAGLTVNILGEENNRLVSLFARGVDPSENAFADLTVSRPGTAGPVLGEAHGYLDGRITARYAPGDHLLLVAEVTAGRVLNPGRPAVHVRKRGSHY